MILSRNFLKDYIDLSDDVTVSELAENMTKVGNEYDSAGKLISANNLVIGEVKECKDHPDSDHLHVCKVDIGSEITQIVCGAANVREGLKVIVALPGAILPEMKIEKAMKRGVESNGMICALQEIGLDKKYTGESYEDGIHELPADAPVGEDPIKYLGLDDDVIDFDLTANRGDLLSIIGMAYEVGAIYDLKVKLPEIKFNETGKFDFDVKVSTENCPLYLARKVENIKIEESPIEIREKLIASGIRPINNVVDISNYVMLETGQPLHFFDADKLEKIEVRMAKENEKLVTLDSQERTLSEEDIVITDGNRPIALAGVMGGLDTEITEKTKNVIIEAAIFNNVKVRKTSNKILRSESSNRFEKGLDPARTYMAMLRACQLLEKYASGTVIAGMSEVKNIENNPKVIDITYDNINNILGTKIDKKDILDVFRKLDFECKEKDENTLTVTVPTRRIDISIKEDLIEEVGRIYGVDNIEGKNMVLDVKQGSYDKTSREIRNKMVNLGLNETLSYVLVNSEEALRFTKYDVKPIKLLDPLTEEKSTLRETVVSALYKIYEYNNARSVEDINLFELGKSFYKVNANDNTSDENLDTDTYVEENKLACLMKGNYILGLNKVKVDFFVIKGVAEEILDYLGFSGRYSFIQDDRIPNDMHPGKSAVISVNGDIVGFIGRVSPVLTSDEVYVMEINLDKLLSKKTGSMKYKEISKFPSVKKDIAVVVDNSISAQELEKTIKAAGGKLLKGVQVFDLYQGKGIPEGKKSIAFNVELESKDSTLTDQEIVDVMTKIKDALANKNKAELRA